ncbi:MAG: hypothetical protein HQL81_05535 [Magnetococcales bacterium]|nr:hypothetical protein [Magnetococcales bacterium]
MNDPSRHDLIGAPGTVLVLGSGCSLGLGVPTLTGFLDHAFALLIRKRDDKKFTDLFIQLKRYIERIKGFGAYMHLDLLNMEELYGLAAMWEGILDENDVQKKEARKVLAAFKQVLFLVYHEAGIEFLDTEHRFSDFDKERIKKIKRESRTEPLDHNAQVNLHTNLMAYLGLASYRDDGGRFPAVIQFNWDLAFDRALWLLNCGGELLPKSELFFWTDFNWFEEERNSEPFKQVPMVIRPHGGLNWIEPSKSKSKDYKEENTAIKKLPKMRNPIHWDGPLICQEDYIKKSVISDMPYRRGERMVFVPPSWKKDVSPLADQWRLCQRYLERARRIVFIGYSMPPSDMNIRYFLALALANNNLVPKVYVWNPSIGTPGSKERTNYFQLFQPMAKSRRLLGIPYKFGHPGLFDLERALQVAKPIESP